MVTSRIPASGIVLAPVIAIILAALSLWNTYAMSVAHNDRESAQKIASVEARQVEMSQRLDRIEDKLDRVMAVLGAKP
jgi:hypothetical protein